MFFRTSSTNIALERVINNLLEDLVHVTNPDLYATKVEQISKLTALRNENSKRLSPDTLALIVANILGIVIIIKHEQVNVVTSKALSFVLKLR